MVFTSPATTPVFFYQQTFSKVALRYVYYIINIYVEDCMHVYGPVNCTGAADL